MSKFCTSCGSMLNDDAAFCTNCGTQFEVAAPAAPEAPAYAAPEAPVYAAPEAAPAPAKKSKKGLIIGICAGVAAIALIIGVYFLFFANSPSTAVQNYIDVTFHGKLDSLEKLAPQEYWDYLEEENDVSLDDLKEQLEETLDDRIEYLEEEYGDNIKVSFKVTKEKDLSERKLEKIAGALEEQYDIDEDSVQAAKELDLELTIKGSDDDDEDETEMTVVKIGGSWYIISYYEYDDTTYVSFLGM